MAPVFNAIGLISGTSADGIDGVLVQTDGLTPPKVLAAKEYPYPAEIRARILALYEPGISEIDRMGALDRDLGELFAQAALGVCEAGNLKPKEVNVIGSHGQTIRHRPPLFTLQIGSPYLISARTGITTVADFRPADMVRGGEGAPLTPLFHQCLFGNKPGERVIVANLGGIANLTRLADGAQRPVLAGDSGPANTGMDLLIQRLSDGAKTFDADGQGAAQGNVLPEPLAWLMAHPYLQESFPKSTGREVFGESWLGEFLTAFPECNGVDGLATLTRFTVLSVADACETLTSGAPDRLVLCGGGAKNPELLRGLQNALPETTLENSAALGVDPDSLEAQAFAWFAVRTLQGLTSSLPEATGAEIPAVLGAIHPGQMA
ncbi:MAG: anhydro-N-acetylmuramic acid kinase [Magnetococcales bacterium]|nr:anhydro-N-acetylmuramic acid kinase [Magnetococcales bacterium]